MFWICSEYINSLFMCKMRENLSNAYIHSNIFKHFLFFFQISEFKFNKHCYLQSVICKHSTNKKEEFLRAWGSFFSLFIYPSNIVFRIRVLLTKDKFSFCVYSTIIYNLSEELLPLVIFILKQIPRLFDNQPWLIWLLIKRRDQSQVLHCGVFFQIAYKLSYHFGIPLQ